MFKAKENGYNIVRGKNNAANRSQSVRLRIVAFHHRQQPIRSSEYGRGGKTPPSSMQKKSWYNIVVGSFFAVDGGWGKIIVSSTGAQPIHFFFMHIPPQF